MTCTECAKEIVAYPCACGYHPKELQAQTHWIVTPCATPGCFTTIRMTVGHHDAAPICKWCRDGWSDAMEGRPAVDIRLRYKETA